MWTAREGATTMFAFLTNFALYLSPWSNRRYRMIRGENQTIFDLSIPHFPPCRAGRPINHNRYHNPAVIRSLGGMASSGIIGMFVGATVLALAWQICTGRIDEDTDASMLPGS
jgi:hypothetical protein